MFRKAAGKVAHVRVGDGGAGDEAVDVVEPGEPHRALSEKSNEGDDHSRRLCDDGTCS